RRAERAAAAPAGRADAARGGGPRRADVDLVLLHEAVTLLRAAGLQDPEFETQQIVDRVAHVRLVVHHEEAVSRQPSHDAPPELSGRKTRKQLPLPGSLETSSRPPCPVTMPWVIDRPRPVPSPTALVVKKGSKTWGRSCGGIPQPLSATSMRISLPTARLAMRMRPPPAVRWPRSAATR